MKQTDLEAARTVHVVVDPFRSRDVTDEEFEEMISAATTFIYHGVNRGLDIMLSLPRITLRSRESQSAEPMFRALALLEATHEPVAQIIERDTVVFTVQGRVT